MVDHVLNREKVIQSLREELVGPSPQGETIDCSGAMSFETTKELYTPYRQKDNGEEILQRDRPTVRYGVGVLYPVESDFESETGDTSPESIVQEDPDTDEEYKSEFDEGILTKEIIKSIEEIQKRSEIKGKEEDSDDFDLSSANSFKPNSMGISFLVEFPEHSKLIVEASGGRYIKKTFKVKGKNRNWWLRSQVTLKAEFDSGEVCSSTSGIVLPREVQKNNTGNLNLNIELYSRPQEGQYNTRLITVCLVNRTSINVSEEHSADDICLFQSHYKVYMISPDGKACILPYPGQKVEDPDPEEQSLALLYRNAETYAVGHGCAADWDANQVLRRANSVSAECLPVFETPSITSDIKQEDGSPIEVPMAQLAGLIPGDDGFDKLAEVIHLYRKWIDDGRKEIPFLDTPFQKAAYKNMDACEQCANRMEEGLKYLVNNQTAKRAFQLANESIILQQINRKPRDYKYDEKACRFVFNTKYTIPDVFNPGKGRGNWRAFQIAFLLMTVKSVAEGEIPEREVVELIWFPTGGGKTEAYLGLAAFYMFMRRLLNHEDTGVNALMRYTLRLLTAQQFQRASKLLLSMEYIRRKHPAELGISEFSIGIWLGGTITPNTRTEAITALNKLKDDKHAENLFVLGGCPWCGAKLGRYDGKLPKKSPVSKVQGYVRSGNTIVFKCPDKDCDFHNGIPVYVIDEDIYEKRPSLVIGTVDKFAMLAWHPEARSLFGIGSGGERETSPPGLIIQDELHLISGPLGSMVGLYETIIEELCTDRRGSQIVLPKIVCSTATIRRYSEQIKAIYGRHKVTLFPPPGLDAGDSFFARYDRDPDGKLRPGRIFVGVHAPGLRSMQTVQVRVFTSLLQAPVPFNDEEKDPWWTLLLFFNSLRELGTTLSLFQSDIPNYLKVYLNRTGKNFSELRRLWSLMELTSRLRGDEVPKAISELEIGCASKSHPVDVCLASNIIEVGVDIDRLSLMSIVGQPKTTSQYIQVSGRVGRRYYERPGVVITLYGASKPRDRSHFEKFRSYHERLYAQVEPTSATPFSPPALDRALHAIMVSYVRQAGDESMAESPYPYPAAFIDQVKEIILNRVKNVDPNELENTKKVFEKRAKQWKDWERTIWGSWKNTGDPTLLRVAGSYATREQERYSWSTPMSMRNVDAECKGEITLHYLPEGDDDSE